MQRFYIYDIRVYYIVYIQRFKSFKYIRFSTIGTYLQQTLFIAQFLARGHGRHFKNWTGMFAAFYF